MWVMEHRTLADMSCGASDMSCGASGVVGHEPCKVSIAVRMNNGVSAEAVGFTSLVLCERTHHGRHCNGLCTLLLDQSLTTEALAPQVLGHFALNGWHQHVLAHWQHLAWVGIAK